MRIARSFWLAPIIALPILAVGVGSLPAAVPTTPGGPAHTPPPHSFPALKTPPPIAVRPLREIRAAAGELPARDQLTPVPRPKVDRPAASLPQIKPQPASADRVHPAAVQILPQLTPVAAQADRVHPSMAQGQPLGSPPPVERRLSHPAPSVTPSGAATVGTP
ncbi:MAG: hypothetical protein ACR2PL_10675 [Dehalococcoidia bacterium]